jgi:hypothetical protein
MGLLFDEADLRATLVAVEQAVPSLEKQRDDGHHGPRGVRGIIDGLVDNLRLPPSPSVSR